jgi:hypothetical protein
LPDKLHVSDLHLAFQYSKNKAGGRLLGNLTNKTNGNALNDKAVKSSIIECFGALLLSIIKLIIQNAIAVAEACGGFEFICMYKEDVVGAFGQFNFG